MKVQDGKIYVYSLEHFMTDRCNLRCQHCSASSPYMSRANLPALDTFARSLKHLSRVMYADQIKILGGEPLLNKELPAFLEVARASRMFAQVRVTTNGTLLSRMPDRFWDLTDVVEISLYRAPNVPTEEMLNELKDTAARHGTRLEVNRIRFFMRAISDSGIGDPDLVQHIYSLCGEAHHWSCHLLYDGRLYRCSRVHTIDRYLSEIGVEHANFTDDDGLPIDGRTSLFEEVAAYLQSPTPLKACNFCLGTSGVWIENRQASAEEIRARKAGGTVPFQRERLVSGRQARMRNKILTWANARESHPGVGEAFFYSPQGTESTD